MATTRCELDARVSLFLRCSILTGPSLHLFDFNTIQLLWLLWVEVALRPATILEAVPVRGPVLRSELSNQDGGD